MSHFDGVLEQVSLTEPWALVETFSTLPRWRPQDVNQAADLIAERLTSFGVPVTLHEPKLYLSIPYEASVELNGRKFKAKTPSYSNSVPNGVTGELIYTQGTNAATLAGFFSANLSEEAISSGALRGKIVLTEGFSIPQKASTLEKAGAAAVITINPGQDVHWAICTPIWGTPGLSSLEVKPNIPVLSVNHPDGQLLIEAAERGESVTIRTHLDEGWFTQKVPVVEIPGATEDFVLLHGHYDSWDVGVGDNATGDATLLEIARVLWAARRSLKRGVRIAWWPGHSTGRYAGSTWYADTFAHDLDQHCVAQVNCDSPGCRWATEFSHVSWMPEMETFGKSIIRDVAGLDSNGARPPRAGDWSFNNIGVTGLFMLSSTMPEALRKEKGYYAVGGCGGNIAWHTENDLIDIADKDIMLRDIKVYLGAVYGLATVDILPIDWRTAATSLRATADRYQAALGDRMSLAATFAALDKLDQALSRFYPAVNAGAIPVDRANSTIRLLSRVLVPLDHARDPRFLHDAALPVEPLPTLALAARVKDLPAESIPFALVELVRGQNRVVGALSEAARLLAEAEPQETKK
jgi:N-acetylated-alpha-linked acidic dipeptidase